MVNHLYFHFDNLFFIYYHLANLVLLDLRKNIQAQNYDFQTKKEAYSNKDNIMTAFHTTRDIIECVEWNEEELKSRKLKLVNKINNVLNIID